MSDGIASLSEGVAIIEKEGMIRDVYCLYDDGKIYAPSVYGLWLYCCTVY